MAWQGACLGGWAPQLGLQELLPSQTLCQFLPQQAWLAQLAQLGRYFHLKSRQQKQSAQPLKAAPALAGAVIQR